MLFFSYSHQTPIKLVYCSRKQHASQSPCPLASLPAAAHSIPSRPPLYVVWPTPGQLRCPFSLIQYLVPHTLSILYLSLISRLTAPKSLPASR